MSYCDCYSISGHNKMRPVGPIEERLGDRVLAERLSIGRSIYWIEPSDADVDSTRTTPS